jgi:hypothetical protein
MRKLFFSVMFSTIIFGFLLFRSEDVVEAIPLNSEISRFLARGNSFKVEGIESLETEIAHTYMSELNRLLDKHPFLNSFMRDRGMTVNLDSNSSSAGCIWGHISSSPFILKIGSNTSCYNARRLLNWGIGYVVIWVYTGANDAHRLV